MSHGWFLTDILVSFLSFTVVLAYKIRCIFEILQVRCKLYGYWRGMQLYLSLNPRYRNNNFGTLCYNLMPLMLLLGSASFLSLDFSEFLKSEEKLILFTIFWVSSQDSYSKVLDCIHHLKKQQQKKNYSWLQSFHLDKVRLYLMNTSETSS